MLKKHLKKLDSHAHEIMSKGVVTFILKIMGAALTFLFQLTISRQLGAAGSGIFFLSLTTIILLATITRLGMDNSITRFVSAYASEHDWAKVKGVTQHALRITFIISLLFSLILFITADEVVGNIFHKPEIVSPFKLMLILTMPMAMMSIYAKALQGLKRSRDTMLMQSVLIPFFACITAIFLVPAFGISGAIAAYAIGVLITLTFGFFTWTTFRSQHKNIPAVFPLGMLISTSLPMMGAILLQQINQSLPLMVLGYWGSNTEAGLFGAAQRTAALVSLVLIAANIIVAPKLSELYQKKDMVTLGRVARQGASFMTIMASPVLLFFLVFPHWVMSLFGSEFSAGWLYLVIMSVGQLINVFTGSVGFLLVMTGNEKSYFSANLIATLLCTLFSLVLIPLYGGIGAAISVALPLSIVNLLRVRFVWRTMGILTIPLPGLKEK